MTGLSDTHCHLLAGLDDGPKSRAQALEMCRIAWQEGTRIMAATAHQNARWPAGTRENILHAAEELKSELRSIDATLTVVPCGEVMITHEFAANFEAERFLTYGDAGKYLLIELPTGVFLDLRDTVRQIAARGVRPVLAHPERQGEMLRIPGIIEELVDLGCLVQVTSDSLTGALSAGDLKRLRQWAERGIIHLLASDGHSPDRRPPRMASAARVLESWIGPRRTEKIVSRNGEAVLTGRPLRVDRPLPPKRSWFARLWG